MFSLPDNATIVGEVASMTYTLRNNIILVCGRGLGLKSIRTFVGRFLP